MASFYLSVCEVVCCQNQAVTIYLFPSSLCGVGQLSSSLPCRHPSCPPHYLQSAVSALSQLAVCFTQQLQGEQNNNPSYTPSCKLLYLFALAQFLNYIFFVLKIISLNPRTFRLLFKTDLNSSFIQANCVYAHFCKRKITVYTITTCT